MAGIRKLAFAADDGVLVLTVPWSMAGWLRQRFGDAIVRGPEPAIALEGGARVARVWVVLREGMRGTLLLGTFGELAVEAA